ncbi:MAG: hypothetical protein OHK0039_44920 [Bacteroidia bacterium]
MDKRTFIKHMGLLAGGVMALPSTAWASLRSRFSTQADAFTLPDLPFDYQALEPHIDEQTMRIHHGKHHAAYVANLNKAVAGSRLEGLSIRRVLNLLQPDELAIRNNGGGHANHSLFWKLLQPVVGATPDPDLAQAIDRSFGSMDQLKTQLLQAGMDRFGSGWAWLAMSSQGTLFISSTPNQDSPLMSQVVPQPGYPLIGIDVWEHAYYLKYQNRRKDYLEAVWQLLNWSTINQQYKTAQHPFVVWSDLDRFHDVMSSIYHPMEEGDLGPVKTRSGELAQEAKLLSRAAVPAQFAKASLSEGLARLRKDSASLHKLVQRGGSDDDIKTSLEALHDVFHQVIGMCIEEH